MKFLRIVTIVAVALMTSTFAQSQPKGQNQQTPEPPSGQNPMGKMKREGCMAMMEEQQKMQAAMEGMDTELNKLVVEMNRAPADTKMVATTLVVTKMAEQRGIMREQTQQMQMKMMQHMMQHMQSEKEPMSQCPMMKKMMQGKETNSETKTPKSDHNKHHQ